MLFHLGHEDIYPLESQVTAVVYTRSENSYL